MAKVVIFFYPAIVRINYMSNTLPLLGVIPRLLIGYYPMLYWGNTLLNNTLFPYL